MESKSDTNQRIADNSDVTWEEGGRRASGFINISSHQPSDTNTEVLPTSPRRDTECSTGKKHHRRHRRREKKKKRRKYSRSPSPSSSSSSSLRSYSNRKDYGSSSRSNSSIKQSTFTNTSNITPSTTQGPASFEPRLFMGIPTAVGYQMFPTNVPFPLGAFPTGPSIGHINTSIGHINTNMVDQSFRPPSSHGQGTKLKGSRNLLLTQVSNERYE